MRPAFAVWMTGLPASGKSTITQALVRQLASRGVDVAVLESDALRDVLTPRPTYSEEERNTFYRSVVYIGTLLLAHGVPVVFDATANRRAYRAGARSVIDRFVEVYVDCPLDVCAARDPKGIYQRARSGEASTVPGVQASYEPPEHPEVVVSGNGDATDAAGAILDLLEHRGYVGRASVATTWEHFAHGADIGIRGNGPTKEVAFQQAALALTSVITDVKLVRPERAVAISCDAASHDLLLADWLNALVYEMATRGMLFSRFLVGIDDSHLHATAWGEPVDRARHEPAVEVKGATYTALRVEQLEDGHWLAQCVVDV